MNSHQKKTVILVVCCALTLSTVIFPTQASADRTHVLTIALLVSGMGLKFGSVFVESSAQDSYDQYLNTAIQADITKHRDDYISKHDGSVLMSRIGIGFVGIAAMISIFGQLDRISKSSQPQSASLRLMPNYDLLTHESTLLLQRRF